jgi:hypothetical protein
MRLLLFPNDNIGLKISAVTRAVLEAIDRRFSIGIEIDQHHNSCLAPRARLSLPQS